MATPTNPDGIIRATVAVLQDGMTQARAARENDIPPRTLSDYVKRVREASTEEYTAPTAPAGELKRVIVVADMHDAPQIPKDRFRWIGRYIQAEQPDQVVQGGDMTSMDSLCGQIQNDSFAARAKPTFQVDMASLDEALDEMDKGLDGYKPPLHKTRGNHENRIWLFEDFHPEMFGDLSDQYLGIMRKHGWTGSPFGDYWNYHGVDFTHIPLSIMGKPMGGMTVANTVARLAVRDTVFFHTHRANVVTQPKVGCERVRVIEAGCALPFGHIEKYKGHSLAGWDWGVWILAIRSSQIEGFKWMSMAELERRYA